MKNIMYYNYKDLIEEHLMDFLPEIDHKSITLYEAMKYSLGSGGKRIRPVLMLAACDFAGGDIKILVSTTVVEVGVDVPEATVMVIMNAESFGLSQLHQLRGRIGRGNRASVCWLVNGGGGDEAADRLKVLAETNDGFRVAEADLKKRGPGDFFGERQSGEFSLACAGAGDIATIKETDGIVATIIENKETGEYSAVFKAAQRFLENNGSTLTVN